MAKEATIARESGANATNALRFSILGENFDSGDAYKARARAREAMSKATVPPLYKSTIIDFGAQGTAEVRRVGTEQRGTFQTKLKQNGRTYEIGDVSYNQKPFSWLEKDLNGAFDEVKRRLGSYIRI